VRPESRSILIYGLVLLIVLADWLTPAGIVVGMLLSVPILLSSAGDDRNHVLAVGITGTIGFVVAAMFGEGPISPRTVWLPNRLFALVVIIASCLLALLLQRRRLQAEAARADAESARDLGRLLHSLMAHDLRAPLALARQALGAVEHPLRSGLPVDLGLVADADARLKRSLRTTQLVLDSARAELTRTEEATSIAPLVDAAREIREEVASFEEEARGRRMELSLELAEADLAARIDPAVLRQSVAILVDNALRHAVPGVLRIAAVHEGAELLVSVRDCGPGLTRRRAEAHGAGEGLGLRLCELLAQRAGGRLEVARDDENGTEFVLRLPTGE
jgi:K+-sensing histidine kinase KdpD